MTDGRCREFVAVDCGLEAGRGRLRIALDYGTVDLESTAGFSSPTVQVLANSVAISEVKLQTGPLRNGQNAHVYSFGELPTPTVAAAALIFQTTVEGGEIVRGPVLTVGASRPVLMLPGCPDQGDCEAVAQVGRRPFTVAIPSGFGVTSAFVKSTLNNIPFGTALEIPLEDVAEGVRSGTRSMTIPDEAGTWTLQATAGEMRSQPRDIILTAPSIAATLQDCPAPCTLPAGGAATVLVTAPGQTTVTDANVAAFLDGAATGEGVNVTLKSCGMEKCALAQLPIPKSANGKMWRATAVVGRYRADSAIASVVAP